MCRSSAGWRPRGPHWKQFAAHFQRNLRLTVFVRYACARPHFMESTSHTRRSTTLKELTNAAVFLASDLAAGMTGTVANLTAGKVSD